MWRSSSDSEDARNVSIRASSSPFRETSLASGDSVRGQGCWRRPPHVETSRHAPARRTTDDESGSKWRIWSVPEKRRDESRGCRHERESTLRAVSSATNRKFV